MDSQNTFFGGLEPGTVHSCIGSHAFTPRLLYMTKVLCIQIFSHSQPPRKELKLGSDGNK